MKARHAAAVVAAWLLAGGTTASGGDSVKRHLPPPERPDACVAVEPGTDLQGLVDGAREGARFCLAPGEYKGPVLIERPVTLFGPRAAVIRSTGVGSTVKIHGHGARLLGVTVSGSGHRYDLLDSAIDIDQADDVRVEGVLIERAMFGILANQTKHILLRGNEIAGDAESALGLRGDGIRLWETTDSRVEDNRVADSRDLVVWYSSHNVLLRNEVVRSRYGTHLMYSNDNLLEHNRYASNEVGVFIMYSRNVELRDNSLVNATGAAGMGVGMKESGNLRLVGNRVVHNTVGFYLDTTPMNPEDDDLFTHNLVALGETGVQFHSSPQRNAFRENDFRDNATQVRVDGGGDALGAVWEANAWDDYAGYDLDGDGRGDVAYAPRSLSSSLTDRYPNVSFFHGSLTLGMVELAGRVAPILAPKTVLVDAHPSVRARETLKGDDCDAN